MPTLALLPEVKTPRLSLREIEPHHTEGFARYMLQPSYQRYTALRLRHHEEVAGFVARAMSRQGSGQRNLFYLAVEENGSAEAIGDGFITLPTPPGSGFYEIGWGLHPAMWQMGLGTEIGEALLSLCFERLNAPGVWCKVMQGNIASRRLSQRIGMVSQGKIGRIALDRDQIEEVEKFTMTAAQYFDKAYL